MKAFYNEIDQQCCAWLSNLMDAGLITPGVICDRSIEDIAPKSLLRYDRVHMFAGIAGWELALSLAGWRHEPGVRVWTGSCPCQPFSSAGKGDGFADQRHLWPAWFHLIRQCRPEFVFGEQVASAIRHGWLDLVSADLEAEGYAVGASVLGAHSVGAPHIRQRLYWLADAGSQRRIAGRESNQVWRFADHAEQTRMGCGSGLADANSQRHNRQHALLWAETRGRNAGHLSETSGRGGMGDAERDRLRVGGRAAANEPHEPGGRTVSAWCGEWRTGADGKARLVKPGIEPLAHGIPARVVRLRAYGNSIVPQAAAAFIGAYMVGEAVVQRSAA